jgi:hypothetical protein
MGSHVMFTKYDIILRLKFFYIYNTLKYLKCALKLGITGNVWFTVINEGCRQTVQSVLHVEQFQT